MARSQPWISNKEISVKWKLTERYENNIPSYAEKLQKKHGLLLLNHRWKIIFKTDGIFYLLVRQSGWKLTFLYKCLAKTGIKKNEGIDFVQTFIIFYNCKQLFIATKKYFTLLDI